MKVNDPFGKVKAEQVRDAAKAVALRSDAALYIQDLIVEHLADLEANDDLEQQFTRGYRIGLRTAYLAAGGQSDGSEESWAQITGERREVVP